VFESIRREILLEWIEFMYPSILPSWYWKTVRYLLKEGLCVSLGWFRFLLSERGKVSQSLIHFVGIAHAVASQLTSSDQAHFSAHPTFIRQNTLAGSKCVFIYSSFGRTFDFPGVCLCGVLSSGIWRRVVRWKSQRFGELPCLLPASCFFLSWLTCRSLRWTWYVPPKHRLTFTGLHDVSLKIEFFIATDVRTSNSILFLSNSTSWKSFRTVNLNYKHVKVLNNLGSTLDCLRRECRDSFPWEKRKS
jgi:hypothetical protein